MNLAEFRKLGAETCIPQKYYAQVVSSSPLHRQPRNSSIVYSEQGWKSRLSRTQLVGLELM